MSDKSRFSVLIESSPPPVSNRANKQMQPLQPIQPIQPLQPIQPSSNNIFKKPVIVTAKTNMPPEINTNNFPELCSQTSEKTGNINFKQIFDQPEMTTSVVDEDLVNLPEGWMFLRRDPSNGKTIMKGLQDRNKHKPHIPDKPVEKSENQLYNELFQSIVETNQKRTNEFIELNDYDVWHAMYQFPTSNHFEDVEEDSESETESDCTYDDIDEDYDYYY